MDQRAHPAPIAAMLAVVTMALGLSHAAAQPLSPLTFTTEQADAGELVYAQRCAGCHGGALQGVFGPALTGEAFAVWLGGTAGALFQFVSANMPMDNPGGLEPEQYLTLVAFIASANGMAAGAALLPADPAALEGMAFRQ